jgi:prophage regulatory protein
MLHSKKGLTPVGIDGLSDDAFVRLTNLIAFKLIPFSPSTLWRKVGKGEFPAPIKVSPGVTAWRVGDIRAWLNSPTHFACHGGNSKNGRAR